MYEPWLLHIIGKAPWHQRRFFARHSGDLFPTSFTISLGETWFVFMSTHLCHSAYIPRNMRSFVPCSTFHCGWIVSHSTWIAFTPLYQGTVFGSACSLAVLQDGTWTLPFWRQRPRPVLIVDSSTNATTVQCVSHKLTTAGVLLSSNNGSTWRATGALGTSACLHPKSQAHQCVHPVSRTCIQCCNQCKNRSMLQSKLE